MSAELCWLTTTLEDVPSHDAWLGPREAQALARLSVAKRRRDWRLGRWAAKEALRCWLAAPPAHERLEILAADDGAPEAFVAAAALPVALSLSHCGETALALVGGKGAELGCDLEEVAPRSPRFAEDYFSAEERAWLERRLPVDCARAVTVIWSAKESALKALRAGLTRDTRELVVTVEEGVDASEWSALGVRDASSGVGFDGWWRCVGSLVMTMVRRGGLPPPASTEAEVALR
jgi:4'-phosphopantetheinyl transferase